MLTVRSIHRKVCASIASCNVFIDIDTVAAHSFVCRLRPQISFCLMPSHADKSSQTDKTAFWCLAKSIPHLFPCRTALSFVSWYFVACEVHTLHNRKEKKNTLPQSAFYFLHQHFKTGQQISWRQGDSEGANSCPYMGKARRRRQAAYAHTHIFTHPVSIFQISFSIWTEQAHIS